MSGKLDFSIDCPYCGKIDSSINCINLCWDDDGFFCDEDGEDKILVECRHCGKTYTYSCKITGIEPKAEKLYDDEEEEEEEVSQ